jgi:hypothetical protein
MGKAICRIDRSDHDFSFEVVPFEKSTNKHAAKSDIIAHSREMYGSYINIDKKQEVAATPPITSVAGHNEIKTESVTESKTTITKLSEGGDESQHRYLQMLIKKMAESKGYRAEIESAIVHGTGRVDVHLQKERHSIACEVSVTTDAAWEVHNIDKCISAGYDEVILCTIQPKLKTTVLNILSDKYPSSVLEKIQILDPEALFLYLDSKTEKQPVVGTTMKGYRVKVQYNQISDQAIQGKKQSITKVVMESLKRVGK